MMSRCNNVNDKDYARTGGAGIRVCAAWHTLDGFVNDMGEKPEGSLLQRLDNSADFEPGNCVWAPLVDAKTNPLYGIWKNIRRRVGVTGKASDRGANHYMARGVVMHLEWQEDFSAFAAHVGPRPSLSHSLDRIDNEAGYVPGNLRWATVEQQANNTEANVFFEMHGVRRTLSQWARHHGLSVNLVYSRFSHLFDPAEPRKQRVVQEMMNGKHVQTYEDVKAASAATGFSLAALRKCLCGGNASSGGYKWRYTTD